MAEDEGVNGDIWTNEACRFFSKAGWETICSQNLDVKDSSGKKRGLDAIFKFQDGLSRNLQRGVFVEAKRYATTSLSAANLSSFILGLENKVTALRRSPGLLETYPLTKPLNLTTGVFVIWFHDTAKVEAFEENVEKYLRSIKVPHGRTERDFNPRVYFLHNPRILRLISMFESIDTWKSAVGPGEERTFRFYYPSSTLQGNPVNEIDALNLEYMFSSFVLAKATTKVAATKTVEVADVVFYFGEVDYLSFQRLATAIQSFNHVDARNHLWLYKHKDEVEDYRKIADDVVRLFESLGPKKVDIRNMDRPSELPAWIRDGETQ